MLGLEPPDQAEPCEVVGIVLASRSALTHRREQALREVEADGPGSHPGKVRELGERIAIVV